MNHLTWNNKVWCQIKVKIHFSFTCVCLKLVLILKMMIDYDFYVIFYMGNEPGRRPKSICRVNAHPQKLPFYLVLNTLLKEENFSISWDIWHSVSQTFAYFLFDVRVMIDAVLDRLEIYSQNSNCRYCWNFFSLPGIRQNDDVTEEDGFVF